MRKKRLKCERVLQIFRRINFNFTRRAIWGLFFPKCQSSLLPLDVYCSFIYHLQCLFIPLQCPSLSSYYLWQSPHSYFSFAFRWSLTLKTHFHSLTRNEPFYVNVFHDLNWRWQQWGRCNRFFYLAEFHLSQTLFRARLKISKRSNTLYHLNIGQRWSRL